MTDIRSMTACPGDGSDPSCPSGSFAVTCNDGHREIATSAEVVADHVCLPVPRCVQVPGDYRTLQDALNADATSICLGARAYDEDVKKSSSTSVTITGKGSAATSIRSIEWDSIGGLTLTGVSVKEGLNMYGGPRAPVRISNCAFTHTQNASNPTGAALGIWAAHDLVEISGCDMSAAPHVDGGVGLQIGAADGRILLHDNVVHDSGTGLRVDAMRRTAGSVVASNNKVDRCETGILVYADGNAAGMSISYTTNVISNNDTGVWLWRGPDEDWTTIQHFGNTYSGNKTNYGGTATPDGS